MKNPINNYNMELCAGEVFNDSPVKNGIGMLLPQRSAKTMLENAALEAGHNRCRALLTKAALEETGALAMMAGRLAQMAPEGSEFYHEILRAYAEKTVQQIERW